jgi:ribosomal protein S18 acetylase RimI-like enzyme
MAQAMTASGAKVMAVSPDLAQAFLDRYGLADYEPSADNSAWGAFEDGRQLIGVAVLGTVSSDRGRVWIAVAPERRRLGVGNELAAMITAAAQDLGLQYLALRYRASDPAPRRLAQALGRPLGRRVDAGFVSTVIALP